VAVMAQAKAPGEAQAIVRRHLAEIRRWRAEGVSGRAIAARLGLSDRSYRSAVARVEGEQPNGAVDVDERPPTNTSALAKIYAGKPLSTSEEQSAWLAEVFDYLPALRHLQTILPVLDTMASQWSEQQSLKQIPEEYQKYNDTYSVRLNERLIDAIKTYAQEHRLTQSELITAAVLRLLGK
jgi:transcriptional regulator with XRE-family HTH domain